MHRKRKIYKQVIYCLIIGFLFLNIGCHFQRGGALKVNPLPPLEGKTIVLGFRPAITHGEDAGMMRSPFSGAVFMSEQIPSDVPDKMTAILFERLQNYEAFELIGPNKAKGVSEGLISSGQDLSEIEILKRTGRAFSADTVMVGYIYRWNERKGTDYSVDSPASAAFELYMIRSKDGAVIWKARFDKTQAPLSENILDMKSFIKGKGKWMTVEDLASLGLNELLDQSLISGG